MLLSVKASSLDTDENTQKKDFTFRTKGRKFDIIEIHPSLDSLEMMFWAPHTCNKILKFRRTFILSENNSSVYKVSGPKNIAFSSN